MSGKLLIWKGDLMIPSMNKKDKMNFRNLLRKSDLRTDPSFRVAALLKTR